MSNRTVRINELIRREISDILRRAYQAEAVAITITEVRVAPDLRDARVFVSVLGDRDQAEERLRWLKSQSGFIREEVGRRVTIKYLPRFAYVLDRSVVRSARLLGLLDELDRKAPVSAATPPVGPPEGPTAAESALEAPKPWEAPRGGRNAAPRRPGAEPPRPPAAKESP